MCGTQPLSISSWMFLFGDSRLVKVGRLLIKTYTLVKKKAYAFLYSAYFLSEIVNKKNTRSEKDERPFNLCAAVTPTSQVGPCIIFLTITRGCEGPRLAG